MKEIFLFDSENPLAKIVSEELNEINLRGVRLYRTRVRSKSAPYLDTFLTTSKDIHLRLGQMSEEAQLALAGLIRETLASANGGGNLLLFENSHRERAVFVTMTPELAIHLAPAS